MFQLMDDVMPFSLDGRVALVTGSSTGLGKAIAFGLARCGARVALNYYNNEERAAAVSYTHLTLPTILLV